MSVQLTHPNEIRKLLRKCAYGHSRVDEKPISGSSFPPVAALINTVCRMGQATGLSGEDTMTLLAYHALLRCEYLQDQLFEHARLTPFTGVIPVDAPKQAG